MSGAETLDFTLDRLDWVPRVDLVDPASATPRQLEVLDGQGQWARRHPFSLTLVHDPDLFEARGRLNDLSMESVDGDDALAPSDREFAALVESHVNGCRFCAFVHGNASIRAGGDESAVHAVIARGVHADLDARTRAIADFAAELAVTPPVPTVETVARLRAVGLGEGEILDLVYAVAQFAWANRTMLTLGTTVRPADD